MRRAQRAHARDLSSAVGHTHPPHLRTQTSSGRRVAHVSRFLAELRHKTNPRVKAGSQPELLSNWTVRGVINVLNVVVEHAIKQEYVASNPVRRLNGEKPPARNRSKARILEAEEVALLIEHAPEAYRSLIFTAAYTGMRQSELLGLRWGDVDFEAETIHVRHQLTRATRKQAARVVALKTDAAERHVDIAPALARELAKHSLGSRHSKPEDFVFATEPSSRSTTAT